MRDIKKITCSCGGKVKSVPTTEGEREHQGCGHDSDNTSCCLMAMKCDGCGIRWLIELEAPEYNW